MKYYHLKKNPIQMKNKVLLKWFFNLTIYENIQKLEVRNLISTMIWFIPAIILPLNSPLLKLTLTGFSVPYSYMYRKYINHIPPPLPSLFTLPLPLTLSPQHDLFYIHVLYCSSDCSLFSRALSWYFTYKYIVF
jgi:hypothetical protein